MAVRRLIELSERFLCLRMVGVLLQEVKEYRASLFAFAFDHIDLGEIEVRLIIGRRETYRLLEAVDCVAGAPGAQVKNAEIIQRFRVDRSQDQGFGEVLIGALRVIQLSVDHPETVIRFGLFGAEFDGTGERVFGCLPILFPTASVSSSQQGNGM